MMLNQFRLFSEHNILMNQRIYDSASKLSASELNENRGAFFKSVLGTLNHILIGDIIWLQRFTSHSSSKQALSYISSLEKPKSLDSILYPEFDQLCLEREKVDSVIKRWINALSESDLEDSVRYKNMAGEESNKTYSSLISHLFLHQVHHRGQVSVLLSQYGLDFGDTDLIEIIANNSL